MSDALAGIILGLAIGFFACLLTWGKTTEHWQTKAAKAGKAEYYLDENNEKQWRWK